MRSDTSLTLEQLRRMDGRPVYWPDDKSWGIISVDDTGRWAGIPFFRGRKNGVNFEFDIESRGMEIYAYQPLHSSMCPACGKEIVTNADRIRAMSDEELAHDRVMEYEDYPGDYLAIDLEKIFGNKEEAVTAELEYLRLPVKEEPANGMDQR